MIPTTTIAMSTQSMTTTVSRPSHSVAMEQPSDLKEDWDLASQVEMQAAKASGEKFHCVMNIIKAEIFSYLHLFVNLHFCKTFEHYLRPRAKVSYDRA